MSTLGKRIGSLVFLEALLTTEEEGLSMRSESDGLAPGKVATADRIPDHLFFFSSSSDNSAPGGEKGSFDQPVENPC
jgi:hypothetical protein